MPYRQRQTDSYGPFGFRIAQTPLFLQVNFGYINSNLRGRKKHWRSLDNFDSY